MLKQIFKIYQITNINPSCKVLITPLGFTVSAVFSGTEAALTLTLLFLWFETRKEPHTCILKHDEENAYVGIFRGLPWMKLWLSRVEDDECESWVFLGLGFGFRGLRNVVESFRGNRVLSILWCWRTVWDRETEVLTLHGPTKTSALGFRFWILEGRLEKQSQVFTIFFKIVHVSLWLRLRSTILHKRQRYNHFWKIRIPYENYLIINYNFYIVVGHIFFLYIIKHIFKSNHE